MRGIRKYRSGKVFVAAALAGLMALTAAANGQLLIDVRAIAANGAPIPPTKFVGVYAGSVVTVGIYLQNGDVELLNGLGGFALGVRSFNEAFGFEAATPWLTNRSPTNTVVNATGGTNTTDSTIMELGFSAGNNLDSNALVDPDPNDTDLDRTGLSGFQSSAFGWNPTYGKVPEIQLGTADFKMNTGAQAGAPGSFEWQVDLNAFYSGASAPGGGAMIKTLTGSGTITNGLSVTNLITGPGNFGAPVRVIMFPEPASMGLLGLASLGLIARRRCNG